MTAILLILFSISIIAIIAIMYFKAYYFGSYILSLLCFIIGALGLINVYNVFRLFAMYFIFWLTQILFEVNYKIIVLLIPLSGLLYFDINVLTLFLTFISNKSKVTKIIETYNICYFIVFSHTLVFLVPFYLKSDNLFILSVYLILNIVLSFALYKVKLQDIFFYFIGLFSKI